MVKLNIIKKNKKCFCNYEKWGYNNILVFKINHMRFWSDQNFSTPNDLWEEKFRA